jgi:transcriptional regulator with XRE-family HTH domain
METLAEYVRYVIRGTPNDKAAQAAGISSGTMHYILSGRTNNPKPETLEAIAKAFGRNDVERRLFYAEMMRLSGYLELLPNWPANLGGTHHPPLPTEESVLEPDQLQAAVDELIADFSTDDAEKALGFFERLRREDPEGFRGYVSWRLALKRANEEGRR